VPKAKSLAVIRNITNARVLKASLETSQEYTTERQKRQLHVLD